MKNKLCVDILLNKRVMLGIDDFVIISITSEKYDYSYKFYLDWYLEVEKICKFLGESSKPIKRDVKFKKINGKEVGYVYIFNKIINLNALLNKIQKTMCRVNKREFRINI